MLLTSKAIASNPESSEEQIPHNRLLSSMTVQYVQQIRWWLEWNLENETAKATKPKLPTSAHHRPDRVQLKAWPNLAPTPASIYTSLHKKISKKNTVTYVGMVVEIMWPCYGVHITVCMALLVFVFCQPVHSCIEPSLHGLDFLFRNLLWRLVSVLFW